MFDIHLLMAVAYRQRLRSVHGLLRLFCETVGIHCITSRDGESGQACGTPWGRRAAGMRQPRFLRGAGHHSNHHQFTHVLYGKNAHQPPPGIDDRKCRAVRFLHGFERILEAGVLRNDRNIVPA